MIDTLQQLMDRTRLHAAIVYAVTSRPIFMNGQTSIRLPLTQLYPPASVEPFDPTKHPTMPELPYCVITRIEGYNSRYSHRNAWCIVVTAPNIDPEYKWIVDEG